MEREKSLSGNEREPTERIEEKKNERGRLTNVVAKCTEDCRRCRKGEAVNGSEEEQAKEFKKLGVGSWVCWASGRLGEEQAVDARVDKEGGQGAVEEASQEQV